MKFIASLILLVAPALLTFAGCEVRSAQADTFGSGATGFDIEFVRIGNPGNAADTTGDPKPAGSVPYSYRIGKFEVSREMVTKANSAAGLGITLFDMTASGGNGPNRPATGVTWSEAARFVNWLNTSQGFHAAYKFTTQPGGGGYSANQNIELWAAGEAGYDPANRFRNSLAHYFLPSMNEWYKAAYYDPASGEYFDFATGSNSAPTAVASGTANGTAVYNGQSGPADIMLAGGLSPYGVMGMVGNAVEWEETQIDLLDDKVGYARGTRGGGWFDNSYSVSSSYRGFDGPTNELLRTGFRVASVPEPGTLLLAAMAAVVIARRRRATC